MKNLKTVSAVFLLISSLFFTACQTTNKIPDSENFEFPQAAYIPQSYNWEKIAVGIESADFESKDFNLEYHLVKIDLHTPGLELVCFPQESDYKASLQNALNDGYFKSTKTSDFAKKNKCVVAVNASPFEIQKDNPFYTYFSKQRKIAGIHKIKEAELSPGIEKYSALSLKKIKTDSDTFFYRATIHVNQNTEAYKDEDFVTGGFFTILKDGKIKDFKANSHDARTAAGISTDGRFLFLLAADGGNFSAKTGLSYPECAQIFINLNCKDALEFDGGNSTQMCVNGKTVTHIFLTNTQASSFGFKIIQNEQKKEK